MRGLPASPARQMLGMNPLGAGALLTKPGAYLMRTRFISAALWGAPGGFATPDYPAEGGFVAGKVAVKSGIALIIVGGHARSIGFNNCSRMQFGYPTGAPNPSASDEEAMRAAGGGFSGIFEAPASLRGLAGSGGLKRVTDAVDAILSTAQVAELQDLALLLAAGGGGVWNLLYGGGSAGYPSGVQAGTQSSTYRSLPGTQTAAGAGYQYYGDRLKGGQYPTASTFSPSGGSGYWGGGAGYSTLSGGSGGSCFIHPLASGIKFSPAGWGSDPRKPLRNAYVGKIILE